MPVSTVVKCGTGITGLIDGINIVIRLMPVYWEDKCSDQLRVLAHSTFVLFANIYFIKLTYKYLLQVWDHLGHNGNCRGVSVKQKKV